MGAARAFAWLGIAVGVVAAAGCKRGGGEPGTCTADVLNVCTEYSAAAGRGGERVCGGGTWRAGAGTCAAEGLLGTCTLQGGAVVEHRYGGPPNNFSAAGAKRACETAGGAWAVR
jgi:hypothetical protein